MVKVCYVDIVFKSKADKGNPTPFKGISGKTGFGIEEASKSMHHKQIADHLDSQSRYTHIYYNWNRIAMQWTTFLNGVTNAKSK